MASPLFATTMPIGLPAGLIAATAAGFGGLLGGLSHDAAWTAAVTALCAVWWMTEALPLAATALVPIAVFPLLGILTPEQTAEAYGNPLILLFLGGFLLSKAMEQSGAHRRLALVLVNYVGATGRRTVLGFMIASAVLSMWVSNTATALMLLPMALAVTETSDDRHLKVSVLLAVAYGASIGGLGTPIGSPPNLVFARVYEETTGIAIGFLDWMRLGLPVVIVFLPIAGWWLMRRVQTTETLRLPAVGAWRAEEQRVLVVFAVTALAWMTRTAPFGGWSQALDLPQANDASVALLSALVLFAAPNGRGGRLLDWQSAATIPWGMLILFAGGIAIAKAFVTSGLSESIGALAAGAAILPTVLLVLAICLSVTFLTEINSNTATSVLLLPILAAAAIAANMDPALLMLPAALSASCAFMLPVATPPNAIVFGSGQVPLRTMMRTGVALNVIGALVITTWICLRTMR